LKINIASSTYFSSSPSWTSTYPILSATYSIVHDTSRNSINNKNIFTKCQGINGINPTGALSISNKLSINSTDTIPGIVVDTFAPSKNIISSTYNYLTVDKSGN
jgi:hypothetical protein